MTAPAAPTKTLHLKLAHLRLIQALDAHLQLGRAAAALSMTQPAASRMLAEVERIVGGAVCERQPRGIAMTRLGRVLARRARNVLTELRDTARELDELSAGGVGIAAVGAVTGGALGYLVPAIQQLLAVSPFADISVEVSPSDVLLRNLQAGTLDFALSRVPGGADDVAVDAEAARPEVVQLLVRADHPLSSRTGISLAELTHFHWIMQAQGNPIRSAVDAAFRDSQLEQPRMVTNTTSLLVMIAMVSSSTAITAVSREVADLLCGPAVAARFRVLDLSTVLNVQPYYLLSARNRTLSPIAERLRALVRAELAQG